MQVVYLDNAGTTALRAEALNAMMEFMSENYANPSSIYRGAGYAKAAVDAAREKVAAAISAARPNEIFFTGSGSEAVNWAIKGIALEHGGRGRHIITTAVEHHASLYAAKSLEKQGFDITFLPCDEFGMVHAEQVADAIRPDTILVSVMMANNEVGTIMPIAEIGALLAELNAQRGNEKRIYFFTDAIQAVGHIPVDVTALGVDLLAISGHKVYGPKGVGALYAKRGVKMTPLIHGGGQERGRRGGTENVAGIVGMGAAIELAMAEMDALSENHRKMRDALIAEILTKIPHSRLNGHPTRRLPGNVNITFEFIEGEGILLLLDSKGFSASSGSACTSGSLDPSHVLLAMGLPHEMAHGSLRLSFGKDTQKSELDKLLEVLPEIVSRLRAMSPLYSG
ncbi:MAG: aminotransferase class V-fold PLP-dependent enzyme [Clostridiales bacterium]|jgi:cysteine desulfurase|nr:aminotransferase class V-fold PLP-dependent enzyme [Clostridiales bacterium]